MSDPAIDLLVARGYKYNPEAGSWSKDGKQTEPTGMLHIDRLDKWLDASLKERKRRSGFEWLPEHKCGLHLSHNEHRDVYETVEEFYDAEDFVSPEEWHKAVAENSVWVLHWYPETPIGFHRVAASTLEAIQAKLKEDSI
jgi:hypothetical protein